MRFVVEACGLWLVVGGLWSVMASKLACLSFGRRQAA